MAEIKMTISAFDVPEVKAELARLRALIKDAEWNGSYRDEACCPWCGVMKGDLRAEPHVGCEAFTPDRQVK